MWLASCGVAARRERLASVILSSRRRPSGVGDHPLLQWQIPGARAGRPLRCTVAAVSRRGRSPHSGGRGGTASAQPCWQLPGRGSGPDPLIQAWPPRPGGQDSAGELLFHRAGKRRGMKIVGFGWRCRWCPNCSATAEGRTAGLGSKVVFKLGGKRTAVGVAGAPQRVRLGGWVDRPGLRTNEKEKDHG
jgi:hypothetical protein